MQQGIRETLQICCLHYVSPHMPAYDWTCRVCESVNPPRTEHCSACGFPAYASGREIQRAIDLRKGKQEPIEVTKAADEPKEVDIVERIDKLPQSKRPLAYALFAVSSIGAGLFELWPGWGLSLLGLAVAIVASIALHRMFPKITLPKRFLPKHRRGEVSSGG